MTPALRATKIRPSGANANAVGFHPAPASSPLRISDDVKPGGGPGGRGFDTRGDDRNPDHECRGAQPAVIRRAFLRVPLNEVDTYRPVGLSFVPARLVAGTTRSRRSYCVDARRDPFSLVEQPERGFGRFGREQRGDEVDELAREEPVVAASAARPRGGPARRTRIGSPGNASAAPSLLLAQHRIEQRVPPADAVLRVVLRHELDEKVGRV